MVIAWEANYGLRLIHTDGRKLPPLGEPQPWWYGYSAGRWEGDTLVVETNNVRGAEMGIFDGWLDVDGSPHSNEVKFTERFRRPTFGKLEIDLTVEDPKAYTKPFTVRINEQVMVDNELIEFICNENQQFRRRVKINCISEGTMNCSSPSCSLAAAALAVSVTLPPPRRASSARTRPAPCRTR